MSLEIVALYNPEPKRKERKERTNQTRSIVLCDHSGDRVKVTGTVSSTRESWLYIHISYEDCMSECTLGDFSKTVKPQ